MSFWAACNQPSAFTCSNTLPRVSGTCGREVKSANPLDSNDQLRPKINACIAQRPELQGVSVSNTCTNCYTSYQLWAAYTSVPMSLYAMLKPNGPSGFGYGSSADDVVRELDLSGTTVLLTGCNSGIGVAALHALTSRGATVLAAARTEDKAREAATGVRGGRVIPVACELSEPSSVRAAVRRVRDQAPALDAIICNAAVMALPRLEVKHGIELQFLTNHVGHFMLVTGLLDHLSRAGRVVVVGSDAHRAAPKGGIDFDNLDGSKRYVGWTAYGRSKLANVLFAKALARRFQGSARIANAVHPGVIHTNISRHIHPLSNLGFALARPLVLKSAAQGAATEVWAAVHPGAAHLNGEYLADCNVSRPRRSARDAALAERLWLETERLIATL